MLLPLRSCDAVGVLGSMRNRSGGPNLRVRTIALIVILGLLGAPILLALLNVLSTVFGGIF